MKQQALAMATDQSFVIHLKPTRRDELNERSVNRSQLLSVALAAMSSANAGDNFRVSIGGLGSCSVRFS